MKKLQKKEKEKVKKEKTAALSDAKTAKPGESGEAPKPTKKPFQLLRGMKDILPKEEGYWQMIYNKGQELATVFGFGRIDTPVVEEAGLFIRSVGKVTDVVEKEMYVFEDKDGTRVAMRPEGTASVARAYIQHGMWNQPQPVKLWYWGPMFRHNRPQAGRYRQFNQLSYEVLGDLGPVVDAQIILVAYDFYKELGLPVIVKLNSMGLAEDRVRYKIELVNYYRANRSKLCDNCKVRLVKNPLRLLDCNEEQCQPVKEDAPQLINFLADEQKKHFMGVLEYLDDLKIPYLLDHTIVRGFDYYTRTVFEVWPDLEAIGAMPKAVNAPPVEAAGAVAEAVAGVAPATAILDAALVIAPEPAEPEKKEESEKKVSQQGALCGGGRYDLLVEELGGRPTPACGLSIGIERTIMQLRALGITPPARPAHLFVAQLGEQAKRRALVLFEELRLAGIGALEAFSKGSLKAQLEVANERKIPLALIIGQKEVIDRTVILRDMESGIQETIDLQKIVPVLHKKLGLTHQGEGM